MIRPLFSFNSWTRFACICKWGNCIPDQRKNMPLHLGCNVLAGSVFGNFTGASSQCRMERGWRAVLHIFSLFCVKKVQQPFWKTLNRHQLPDGAARVTPQWRGRLEAVLPKEDPSRSWRRKLRALAEALNGVFGAAQWYVALIPYWGFWHTVIVVA